MICIEKVAGKLLVLSSTQTKKQNCFSGTKMTEREQVLLT